MINYKSITIIFTLFISSCCGEDNSDDCDKFQKAADKAYEECNSVGGCSQAEIANITKLDDQYVNCIND